MVGGGYFIFGGGGRNPIDGELLPYGILGTFTIWYFIRGEEFHRGGGGGVLCDTGFNLELVGFPRFMPQILY